MGSAHVHEEIRIHAPMERVFERITDHERMGEWLRLGAVRLVREGSPRNGVGAVREIRARGLRLLEEVVHYEPPKRMDYRITRGLPVRHRGQVSLEPEADGVHVVWDVRMESRWPAAAEVAGRLLARELGPGLERLKRQLETGAPGA